MKYITTVHTKVEVNPRIGEAWSANFEKLKKIYQNAAAKTTRESNNVLLSQVQQSYRAVPKIVNGNLKNVIENLKSR